MIEVVQKNIGNNDIGIDTRESAVHLHHDKIDKAELLDRFQDQKPGQEEVRPDVDVGLELQSIDEDHDNFTEKTCVNVKTWSSFEEISDFEEVGSLESLVDKTDENCEN